MGDLSVTRVQEALRGLAEGGHDIISRVGGVGLSGKHYPMAYAHGLEFPENQKHYRGYSVVPLSESGNVALIYSSNDTKHGAAKLDSAHVMHPVSHLGRNDSSGIPAKHWYESLFSAEDEVDWYSEGAQWYTSAGRDIHESMDKMVKVPGEYSIYGENLPKNRNDSKNLHRLKEHNPAEAAWNTITNNMRFGHTKWVPHPKELDLRNLGRVVHVYDKKSDTSHLYHPETEQLFKI